MTDKSIDEVAEKANTSETTEEESGTEEVNPEDSTETEEKVETESESTEEVESDYLGTDTEDEKDETDYKKRYADSTRSYQTLKAEKENLSLLLNNLDDLVKINPKITEAIEEARRLQGQANQGLPASSTLIQQQVDKALEPILEPIKKVAQGLQDKDRRANAKTIATFERKNPKFFSTLKDKEKKSTRQRIGKVANALVETGMDYPEALERAYLTVNPKAAVQKGKNEAYLESLDESQAGFSSQAGTEGKKASKAKYTKAELNAAKKMGKGVYEAMLKDTK